MSDIAKIELSKDLIEPIVRAQLHASILAALGRTDQLVASVVASVMNTRVDDSGAASHYNSAKPLITWMAEKAIKEAAMDAIKEWFAENREAMKKQLHASITKNSKSMADQFVTSMAKASESVYHHSIEVRITPKDSGN